MRGKAKKRAEHRDGTAKRRSRCEAAAGRWYLRATRVVTCGTYVRPLGCGDKYTSKPARGFPTRPGQAVAIADRLDACTADVQVQAAYCAT
jgi:hypothetical protein